MMLSVRSVYLFKLWNPLSVLNCHVTFPALFLVAHTK